MEDCEGGGAVGCGLRESQVSDIAVWGSYWTDLALEIDDATDLMKKRAQVD
jgi:hypothetical protein